MDIPLSYLSIPLSAEGCFRQTVCLLILFVSFIIFQMDTFFNSNPLLITTIVQGMEISLRLRIRKRFYLTKFQLRELQVVRKIIAKVESWSNEDLIKFNHFIFFQICFTSTLCHFREIGHEESSSHKFCLYGMRMEEDLVMPLVHMM